MITDQAVLQELQAAWLGVRSLRDKVQRAILGSFAQGASAAILAADIAHNLPFLHACSVLNDVLQELSKEGRITCKSIFLGELMKAGKGLPWKNRALIEQAVSRRNEVAHHAEIVPRGECWKYIDAIEAELISWGLVNPP